MKSIKILGDKKDLYLVGIYRKSVGKETKKFWKEIIKEKKEPILDFNWGF